MEWGFLTHRPFRIQHAIDAAGRTEDEAAGGTTACDLEQVQCPVDVRSSYEGRLIPAEHRTRDRAAMDNAINFKISKDGLKIVASAEVAASNTTVFVLPEIKTNDAHTLGTKSPHNGTTEKSGRTGDKDRF